MFQSSVGVATSHPALSSGLSFQTILTWRDVLWYLQRKEVLQGGSWHTEQTQTDNTQTCWGNAIAFPYPSFFLSQFLFYFLFSADKLKHCVVNFASTRCFTLLLEWPRLTQSTFNFWGVNHTKECPAHASTLLLSLLPLCASWCMHAQAHRNTPEFPAASEQRSS